MFICCQLQWNFYFKSLNYIVLCVFWKTKAFTSWDVSTSFFWHNMSWGYLHMQVLMKIGSLYLFWWLKGCSLSRLDLGWTIFDCGLYMRCWLECCPLGLQTSLTFSGLSLKFQIAGYMQLVGGELYSEEVLLVLFCFCFLYESSQGSCS